MKYRFCIILFRLANQTHLNHVIQKPNQKVDFHRACHLASFVLHAQTNCNDPFASNFNEAGDCTYCTPSNALDSSPSEEFTIGSGLSNDHMNVGLDACNGISASLGVLERYVGNVEPEAGNLTNYQVNNGFADVPEGVEAGARWNYLLSVNLGEYTFSDVEVTFGLDFDPAEGFDPNNLEGIVHGFWVVRRGLAVCGTETGIDYANESLFQDSQNFDFGFWAQLVAGAGEDFDPYAVGVYNLGVYVHSLERRNCWPLLRSAWRPWRVATIPLPRTTMSWVIARTARRATPWTARLQRSLRSVQACRTTT